MIIPRFTMKWLLLIVVVAAVFSLLISWAVRGDPALIAVVVALASLPLALAVFASTFLLSWAVARCLGLHRVRQQSSNPFALTDDTSHRTPPSVRKSAPIPKT